MTVRISIPAEGWQVVCVWRRLFEDEVIFDPIDLLLEVHLSLSLLTFETSYGLLLSLQLEHESFQLVCMVSALEINFLLAVWEVLLLSL